MAKKAGKPVKAKATTREIRHIRLEFPPEDYERLKRMARANALPMTAYLRQAAMMRIRRDEAEMAGVAK